MTLKDEMILEEYSEKKDKFEIAKDSVIEKLKEIFKASAVNYNIVEGRVKAKESLSGKLERKGYKYASLSDITDIIGIRIIVYYNEDIDRAASIVEKHYKIDRENSVDKRKMLDYDRFGYLSLHYICYLPDDLNIPEVKDQRFEIQIRTVLQHMWSMTEHDSGYKSEIEVPKTYLRRFSRLAGILEIADEEMSNLLNEIDEYRRQVKTLLRNGNLDELAINGDTFSDYIKTGAFNKLNDKIAGLKGAEIVESSYVPFIKAFEMMGMTSIADIEKMKNDYFDYAFKLAAAQLIETDIDILISTIGLRNLCIVKILNSGGGKEGLTSFFNVLNGGNVKEKVVEKIYNEAMNLGIIGDTENGK